MNWESWKGKGGIDLICSVLFHRTSANLSFVRGLWFSTVRMGEERREERREERKEEEEIGGECLTGLRNWEGRKLRKGYTSMKLARVAS